MTNNGLIKKLIPLISTLKTYDKSWLAGDLGAGLTVGVMLIPQGMAYAMLAGLPPIYGLYASTIPLIIYALFGTSRQLAVGPVAMISLLVASGIGLLAGQDSMRYIELAITLALLVGIIQLLLGVFRLGFLVNFLSHPVISGFTSAAAIIIATSQLKHIFGIQIPRSGTFATLQNLLEGMGSTNLWALFIGSISIALLIGLRKWNSRLPAPLIIVILGMGLVYYLGLSEEGVKIIGEIPGGLPKFSVPEINFSDMMALFPMALTISFVGFMESIAVAKAVHARHKNYELSSNQELVALGLSNVLGSFFRLFPVTGGFSRTAVNDQAGAKTGLSSLISALLIMLTLLFFTEYFYYLPNAVLAAIIIVAVVKLIDIKEAKHLWKQDKRDFGVFIVTAIATLSIGIEQGVLAGVILSLIMLIYKQSYPHIAVLGRIPGSEEYRNIERFDHLEIDSELLMVRFDAQLYFGNSNAFKDFIVGQLYRRTEVKHIVVDCSAITDLDSSAIHMFRDLVNEVHAANVEIYLSNVRGPVRDTLFKNGIMNKGNIQHFFLSNHEAVQNILFNEGHEFKEYVGQSDLN